MQETKKDVGSEFSRNKVIHIGKGTTKHPVNFGKSMPAVINRICNQSEMSYNGNESTLHN